jgi:hypothetical protein
VTEPKMNYKPFEGHSGPTCEHGNCEYLHDMERESETLTLCPACNAKIRHALVTEWRDNKAHYLMACPGCYRYTDDIQDPLLRPQVDALIGGIMFFGTEY